MKLAIVRDNKINTWDVGTYQGVATEEIEVYACGTKAVSVPNVEAFVYVRPWEILEKLGDDLIIDVPDPHYEFSRFMLDRHDRVVVTAWDNLLGKNHDSRTKAAMKKAWKFVARTQMIKYALEWDGVPEEKIEVIPAGIDTNEFVPLPDREDAVYFCGRVVPEKGLKDLIWAMKGVQAELWVAGEAGDKKDFYDLWAFNAGVKIKWLGFLNRVEHAQRMGRAKIFSCPSYPLGSYDPFGEWLEQFGQVYIEAMSCGTPVVTTSCGGPSEILTHGRNSWLVPARHWHGLHNGIVGLLQNKDVWETYSGKAREDCVKTFSIQAIGSRIRDWYFNE